MTITVPLDRLADFAAAHPWLTIVLVFLFGVVLPAVWSARRHAAALAVLQVFRDTVVGIAAIMISTWR